MAPGFEHSHKVCLKLLNMVITTVKKMEWGKSVLSEKQMPKTWYCWTNLKNMFLWGNEIFGLQHCN